MEKREQSKLMRYTYGSLPVTRDQLLQDATVRKLYTTVRHNLKSNWGITGSFQLFVNGTNLLVKNNNTLSASGLYNGITLITVSQAEPYSWDLFVKLPGRLAASTVTLYEVCNNCH